LGEKFRFLFYPFRRKMQQMSTKSRGMSNYVIFYMSSIKKFQFLTFFDNFKFSAESKMAHNMGAILNDVTGPQQRSNP